jgi:hypothetical protein
MLLGIIVPPVNKVSPITAEDCILINLRGLASRMNTSYDYVKDMKKMGFELPYGGMTTLSHALNWINANPDFRADARLLKLSNRPKHPARPQPLTADKFDAPQSKRGSRSSSRHSQAFQSGSIV